jgi:Rnl2 family RNA ligase
MRFDKYTSIENTYQTPYMEKVFAATPKNLLWDVTEKVHGSNCCIITDGNQVEFAKRSGIITDNNFFNYKLVLKAIKNRIINAFNYIKKPVKVVQFYGELFGGYYPHEKVQRDSRFSAVQKGIYYCPYQTFYGFDIALCYEDGSREWLNPDEVAEVYRENHIFYARSLFRGTLEECLKFPNTFQTHIPEWLGFPSIEGNTCEGVVLKPMIPQFFNNGGRIVLKNKSEKFAEKKKEHIHKEVKDVPEVVAATSETMNEYITDARLCNVISHEGEFDMPKEFGKLMKLFTADILNDFYKEHLDEWNSLEKGNQRMVTNSMTKAASAVIKQHFGVR